MPSKLCVCRTHGSAVTARLQEPLAPNRAAFMMAAPPKERAWETPLRGGFSEPNSALLTAQHQETSGRPGKSQLHSYTEKRMEQPWEREAMK